MNTPQGMGESRACLFRCDGTAALKAGLMSILRLRGVLIVLLIMPLS